MRESATLDFDDFNHALLAGDSEATPRIGTPTHRVCQRPAEAFIVHRAQCPLKQTVPLRRDLRVRCLQRQSLAV